MTETARAEDSARWRANLQGEIDGIAIYRAMAAAERDPSLATVYVRLAQSETRHAALWERKLRDAGTWVPAHTSWRARALAFVAQRFGTGWVTATVAGREAHAQAGFVVGRLLGVALA